MEINSSFYRPHRRSTYERWAAAVPDDFKFCVKAPKEITHVRRCEGCDELLTRFLDESAGLGEKRRVLLVQLPPKFEFDPARMAAFFAGMRSRYTGFIVCEPRHASWFSDDAEALLRDYRIGRAGTDPPRSSSDDEAGGWNGIAYYRLHGSPRIYYSRYDETAVTSIAARLRDAASPERWCIFDNTAAGAALENALEAAAAITR